MIDIKAIKTEIKKNKDSLKLARTNTISEIETKEILLDMKDNLKLDSIEQAFIILAIASQQGGTARGCSGNLEFEYCEKKIKLANIRNSFKSIINDRYALRKFARTYASEFYQICNEYDIQGNLVKKINRLHPEISLTKEEAVWLSDYQINNEDLPTKLKDLIISTFEKNNNYLKNNTTRKFTN